MSATLSTCPLVPASCAYRPVSQSCAVAKSDKFWRTTEQSNLADTVGRHSTHTVAHWPVE